MKKYLNIISINEYKIIGSYTDPNIKPEVISDIDGQDYEIFENNNLETYKKIEDHFKNVFKKLKDNKRAVITDFKCGIDNTNTPYRWKYKDIQRGYLYDENGNKIMKLEFVNSLEMEKEKTTNHTSLLNIRDEMLALVQKTRYLLTLS